MKLIEFMRSIGLALAAVLVAGALTNAAGQAAVNSADIQRLQDTIYDASRDLGPMRPALVTEETTPLISEPAGTTTRSPSR